MIIFVIYECYLDEKIPNRIQWPNFYAELDVLTVGDIHTFPTLSSRTDRISQFISRHGLVWEIKVKHVWKLVLEHARQTWWILFGLTRIVDAHGLLYSCPTHVIITMIFDYGALLRDFDTI